MAINNYAGQDERPAEEGLNKGRNAKNDINKIKDVRDKINSARNKNNKPLNSDVKGKKNNAEKKQEGSNPKESNNFEKPNKGNSSANHGAEKKDNPLKLPDNPLSKGGIKKNSNNSIKTKLDKVNGKEPKKSNSNGAKELVQKIKKRSSKSGGKKKAAKKVAKAILLKYKIVIGAVLGAVALFVLLIGVYIFCMPGNIIGVVSEVVQNVGYTITDSVSSLAKDFYFGIYPKGNPLSDESLEDDGIKPIDGEDYDSKDPLDMAYLSEYKIFIVSFHDAYDMGVDKIKTICDMNGFDYDLTMESFNDKYPNGWNDVYKKVNYGDLISIAYMNYEINHKNDKIPVNYFDDLKQQHKDNQGNTSDSETNSSETDSTNEENYTLPEYYMKDLQETMLSYETKNRMYQMGYEIKTKIITTTEINEEGKKVEKKTEYKYLDLEMKPFSMNTFYDVIGLDKNATYDANIVCVDMMDSMTKQIGASLEDCCGKEKIMFSTLHLYNNTPDEKLDWDDSFSSNNIADLFKSPTAGDITNFEGTNVEIVYQTLIAEGLSPTASAAVVGNLMAESGPELSTEWKGDGSSVGIAQWLGERKRALEGYAAAHNLSKTDIHAQAGYLALELKGNAHGGDTFRDETDIINAADLVAKNFEGCAQYASHDAYLKGKHTSIPWHRFVWSEKCQLYIIDLSKRREYSQKVFDAYGNRVNANSHVFPCPNYTAISSGFGQRNNPTTGLLEMHKGVDLAAPEGTPIYAAESGTVVSAAYSNSAGNWVKIKHDDGAFTVYMHASALYVNTGDTVTSGQLIAAVGSTGQSTGNHLHFGVMLDDEWVSPWSYVNKP